MQNVSTEVKGNILTIKVDLKATGVMSASGKSKVIASTKGNVGIPGTAVKIGLNVYEPVTAAATA